MSKLVMPEEVELTSTDREYMHLFGGEEGIREELANVHNSTMYYVKTFDGETHKILATEIKKTPNETHFFMGDQSEYMIPSAKIEIIDEWDSKKRKRSYEPMKIYIVETTDNDNYVEDYEVIAQKYIMEETYVAFIKYGTEVARFRNEQIRDIHEKPYTNRERSHKKSYVPTYEVEHIESGKKWIVDKDWTKWCRSKGLHNAKLRQTAINPKVKQHKGYKAKVLES